jgi:hypothetical protein
MSIFDNLFNNLWGKIEKLSEDKIIEIAVVHSTYGFLRKQFNDTFILILEKALNSGNIYGNDSQIHELLLQNRERLINTLALGLLSSCRIPENDPSGKLAYINLVSFTEMLYVFFQLDENYQSNIQNPINPNKGKFSSDPDVSRNQVIAIWMNLLKISDPEFGIVLDRYGFIKTWYENIAVLISGTLTGLSRVSNNFIIERLKRECSQIKSYHKQIYEEMISSYNQIATQNIKKGIKPLTNIDYLFTNVVTVNGKDRLSPSKQGNSFVLILAATMYVSSNEIPLEIKLLFSKWANLPIGYWGKEHKQLYALADLHFLKYAHKKGVKIRPDFKSVTKQLQTEELPPLPQPLSREIINFFLEIYG